MTANSRAKDILSQPRLSGLSYVWLICLVAAMGGLLFGYDWVVIGGAKPFFEKYFELQAESLKRMGQQLCVAGLPGRFRRFGWAERPLWPPAAVAGRRGPVWRFVRTHRLGLQFPGVRRLANSGRRSDRHGLEPVADVHRRGGARRLARPAGCSESTDHRHRHLAGADRQLADRRTRPRRQPRPN